MIMQIVGCIGILTMREQEEDLIVMKVEKEDRLFSIDAIIREKLQGIIEHLMINWMNKKEMYLYVYCVRTLDTHQGFAKWIEET